MDHEHDETARRDAAETEAIICADCAASQGSHGGCRAAAYAFHGRFEAPDPYDSVLNGGLDLTRLPDAVP